MCQTHWLSVTKPAINNTLMVYERFKEPDKKAKKKMVTREKIYVYYGVVPLLVPNILTYWPLNVVHNVKSLKTHLTCTMLKIITQDTFVQRCSHCYFTLTVVVRLEEWQVQKCFYAVIYLSVN